MGSKRSPASARKATPKKSSKAELTKHSQSAKKSARKPARTPAPTPQSQKKKSKKQPVVEEESSSEEEEEDDASNNSEAESEGESEEEEVSSEENGEEEESSEEEEESDAEDDKKPLKGDDIWGGSDDEMEETEIEREARLEQEREEEDRAYEEEEAANADRAELMETFELPGDGEEQESQEEIGNRIKEIVGILNDFRAQSKNHTQSRSDFIEQLTKDCAKYYQYLPELISLFLTLFSPNELIEFLEANEVQRPVVIRTNTLKARRRDLAEALASRGVNLQPLAPWTKVGLKILESEVPIGATPEYLAGHYMLQSAASFTPVIAMAPQPGEKILDMASAPGGKTSYIAQLMKNTGLLVANDLKKERIAATVANLARLGIRNTVCCNHNGKDFPKVVGGFDRVLLDAPCSGLGVIARDPSVKMQRTVHDIRTTAHLQKELLLAAIDSCDHKSKTGGFVVYSTCSVSAEENEMVVQYALEKRHVKLVDPGVEYAKKGLSRYMRHRFHPSMTHTRRLYPHVHNMDGFFVAKFKKLSNKKVENTDKNDEAEDESESESEDDVEMDVEEEQEEAEARPLSRKEKKKLAREERTKSNDKKAPATSKGKKEETPSKVKGKSKKSKSESVKKAEMEVEESEEETNKATTPSKKRKRVEKPTEAAKKVVVEDKPATPARAIKKTPTKKSAKKLVKTPKQVQPPTSSKKKTPAKVQAKEDSVDETPAKTPKQSTKTPKSLKKSSKKKKTPKAK